MYRLGQNGVEHPWRPELAHAIHMQSIIEQQVIQERSALDGGEGDGLIAQQLGQRCTVWWSEQVPVPRVGLREPSFLKVKVVFVRVRGFRSEAPP